jgi:uncharacterized ion transporter superfamily protein YfcC
MEKEQILKINKRSFITVCIILISFMILAYVLTFLLPKHDVIPGNDEYLYPPIADFTYPFWKFITAPVRVLGTSDGLNLIVISLFILILGGAFNIMNQTGGINTIISYLIGKFKNRRYYLLYTVVLFFMLFGAIFGIFEESVTLLPIIIMLALSLGWDTFTGLGMCLLAAGFGFSTAITNPFSVGLGSDKMGIDPMTNIWFRIIIFILMYVLLCVFLKMHVKKIEKNPEKSPTYESDQKKREQLNFDINNITYDKKLLKGYSWFFLSIFIAIILAYVIPFLRNYSIPLIALTALIVIFICGAYIKVEFKKLLKMFWEGLVAMSPAIIMLLLAGSIKFILDEGKIMGTIIIEISDMLSGRGPIVGVLFIYLVVLVIQFFIGSASAKVALIVPIIAVLAVDLGISKNLALLSFIFADGYTDLIYPTNPVLLIALGMASFNYLKWIKKTILLQILVLLITVGLLILGFYIGY